MPARIVVRLLVDSAVARADDILARAVQAAATCGASISAEEVEPYWKEPGWLEASFQCALADAPRPALEAVLAVLGGAGWTRGGDDDSPDAVWHAGLPPVDTAVRWASVDGMHDA